MAMNAEGATPSMAQWFAVKAAHPEALLFFRMGDFYEMFFGDAEAASSAIDIALTYRGEHRGSPIPMCGVPAHAHEMYLARLIRRGFRVAICEQMETPEEAKKRRAPTLRREVVRVVTPGTVTEEALLEAGRPAWLLAAVEGGAAWLDVSTGAFQTEAVARGALAALVARIEPAELVVPEGFSDEAVLAAMKGALAVGTVASDPGARLAEAFGVATLDGFGVFSPPEIAAAAMAVDYVRATQVGVLPRLAPPAPQGGRGLLLMDAATRRSLEILRGERSAKDCLLGAVDRTLTAAGARELAARLGAPLAEAGPIVARHEAVGFLVEASGVRGALRAALKGAPDMARALGRLSLDRFAPRDLAAVRDGLQRAGRMAEALVDAVGMPPLPGLLREAVGVLAEPGPQAELARALAAELPARLDEPGLVAVGYDGELDALRRLRDDARGAIAAMQMELAKDWGVASLKVKHHQQFGYLAEMPLAAGEALLRQAPGGAHAPIHRQTMSNAMRFTCAALAELDRKLAEAGERARGRERAVAQHLRRLCLEAGVGIAASAEAMAALDVLSAAAEIAAAEGWVRPEMGGRGEFAVVAGRHPVVETALARARGPAFVPNDCDLGAGRRLCLLTGPNMAGKSTYLRQNALLVVLAQAGMFVPARRAVLGVVDRLFSRVGASDDLAGGRSTFMVEMSETAAILNQASDRSLVVLDEVGRGTATWDGLAIAWAVLEALHDRVRCRAIFATHFHELTALEGKLPALMLATMQVREWRGSVVFQHSVGPGAAEKSWGLHVARLAGVPRGVVIRAEAVLRALEERARGLDPLAEELPLFARGTTGAAGGKAEVGASDGVESAVAGLGAGQGIMQPQGAAGAVLAALRALEPDELSPREAQAALYRLKLLLEGDAGLGPDGGITIASGG